MLNVTEKPKEGDMKTPLGFRSSAKTRRKIKKYASLAKVKDIEATLGKRIKQTEEKMLKKLEETIRVEKWKPARSGLETIPSDQDDKTLKMSWLTKRVGKNLKQSFGENTQAYCLNTTLHGFAYIVNGKGLPEKLFWMAIVILGFLFGGMVVNDAFSDWAENPIITTIDTFSYPVQNIQYPTVTVCYGDTVNYDPWAFVRNNYNRYEFSCQTASECEKSKELRRDFRNVLMEVAKDFASSSKEYECNSNSWYRNICDDIDDRREDIEGNLTAYLLSTEDRHGIEEREEGLTDLEAHLVFDRKDYEGTIERFPRENRASIYRPFLDAVDLLDYFDAGSKEGNITTTTTESAYGDYYDTDEPTSNLKRFRNCIKGQYRDHRNPNITYDRSERLAYYKSCLTDNVTDSEGRAWEAVRKMADYDFFIMDSGFLFEDFPTYKRVCQSKDYWGWCNKYETVYAFDEEVELYLSKTRSPSVQWTRWCLIHGNCTEYAIQSNIQWMSHWACSSTYDKMHADCVNQHSAKVSAVSKRIGQTLALPQPRNFGFALEHFGDKYYGRTKARDSQMFKNLFDDKTCRVVSPADLFNLILKDRSTRGSECWAKEQLFSDHLPEMIKILRQEWYLSRSNASIMDHHYDYYPLKGSFHEDDDHHHHGLVLTPGNSIGTFSPVLTDAGLCEVHNAMPLSQTYRPNEFIELVQDMFNIYHNGTSEVANISGSGKYLERSIWLNVKPHQACTNASKATGSCGDASSKGYAIASLNNWRDFFSVVPNSIEVFAGSETVLKVRPVMHVASSNFRDLTLENRKCRFSNENPSGKDSMFTYYTQKSCMFECCLNFAVKETGCTPWDFPRPRSHERLNVCTNIDRKLADFYTAMKNKENILRCDCLPDCEETNYEIEIITKEIKIDDLCRATGNKGSSREAILDYWRKDIDIVSWRYKNFFSNPTWDTFSKLVNEADLTMYEGGEVCKGVLRTDLAKLTIVIPNPTAMKVKKSVRVSFNDQLGMLGTHFACNFTHKT